MPTCGRCKYGQVVHSQMKHRMCFGHPPTVLMFPTNKPPGFELRAIRPVVSIDDPACSVYQLDVLKMQAGENATAIPGEKNIKREDVVQENQTPEKKQ